MELKYSNVIDSSTSDDCSNRTFMELKFIEIFKFLFVSLMF